MEYSIWLLFDAIWSTPCGHYFMPYGVLHMVGFCYHMEYLRIHHRDPCLLPHGVLHMAALWCHMEYSMWPLFHAIWSTPYTQFLVQYGVLQDLAQRSIYVVTWSTPYGCFLIPYGVLHMVSLWCHMEHLMFNQSDQFLVPHGVLHMATFWCHMEYAIWSLFHAIWSTPYGRNLRPYGVLHRIINNVYCWRNTKCSRRLISTTPWSTPCGHYFMPLGVLHMVGFWCHMEYFRIQRSVSIVTTWKTLSLGKSWSRQLP